MIVTKLARLRVHFIWLLVVIFILLNYSDYIPFRHLTKYIYTAKKYTEDTLTLPHTDRPWYFEGGQQLPTSAEKDPHTGYWQKRLWPNEAPDEERIENQLMFLPPSLKPKLILFYTLIPHWARDWGSGSDVFKAYKCPVDSCITSTNISEAHVADAIVFYWKYEDPGDVRHKRQVWIWSTQECPLLQTPFKHKDVINWTMTYRRDSDVPQPYIGLWKYYDRNVTQKDVDRNYAAKKTKNVAWFVSNCNATNNRFEYAQELSKYIEVDIYGKCGDKSCPRFESEGKCFEMLDNDYRFYLAFENSNCREYITEKMLDTALGNNVLPIVMGAHPDDYARVAPENSYIHVDFFKSPKDLATYLLKLIEDDDLYNSYFRWKGTGEFVKTPVACQLCAMLHDDFTEKSYPDINEWWWGKNVCRKGPWNDTRQF